MTTSGATPTAASTSPPRSSDPAGSVSFSKASVRDAPVAGERVLLRVDLNVPLERRPAAPGRERDPGSISDSRGVPGAEEAAEYVVADDMRIEAALPTIGLLRERGASLVV